MAEQEEQTGTQVAQAEDSHADEVGQIDDAAGAESADGSVDDGETQGLPDSPGVSDASKPPDVEGLLAMKVPVIVTIAQKKISMSDVLKLNVSSIITFDKDAYDNIDLMVNNSPIALGQPVKIHENFGLRIMEILPPAETIRVLGGNDSTGD